MWNTNIYIVQQSGDPSSHQLTELVKYFLSQSKVSAGRLISIDKGQIFNITLAIIIFRYSTLRHREINLHTSRTSAKSRKRLPTENENENVNSSAMGHKLRQWLIINMLSIIQSDIRNNCSVLNMCSLV